MERPVTSPVKRLLFGTAGVPHTSEGDSTLKGIERVSALGLDCMEIEHVRGIRMGADTARAVRDKAESLGITLSLHAPYYINLLSADRGKRLASEKYILTAARTARLCGAHSVVFHAGYYGAHPPEVAYEEIKKALKNILSVLKSEGNPVALRIETMGKRSQFGTLEEVLFLCRELEGLAPCVDFCHIHAREGRVNSFQEFDRVLRKLGRKLGPRALKSVHFHVAGVEYGRKGEIKHLDLRESNFRYDEWIEALKQAGVAGTVICESPNLEADALMLKSLYHSKR
ncbi:MAG: TIM barrel protein [Candidatus Aminicenantes bacterium]|nr:TIM barrel protein [Candidatus Aminicenantes bacterium]